MIQISDSSIIHCIHVSCLPPLVHPEREALSDLRDQLSSYDGPLDDEALQSLVFACGRERFEPLRDWFKAIYEVLLGASQGPRFGGFIALYGVAETAALIEAALAGDFIKD